MSRTSTSWPILGSHRISYTNSKQSPSIKKGPRLHRTGLHFTKETPPAFTGGAVDSSKLNLVLGFPFAYFSGTIASTQRGEPVATLIDGERIGDLQFSAAHNHLAQRLRGTHFPMAINRPLGFAALADAMLEIGRMELGHFTATIRFVVGSALTHGFMVGSDESGDGLVHGRTPMPRGDGGC